MNVRESFISISNFKIWDSNNNKKFQHYAYFSMSLYRETRCNSNNTFKACLYVRDNVDIDVAKSGLLCRRLTSDVIGYPNILLVYTVPNFRKICTYLLYITGVAIAVPNIRCCQWMDFGGYNFNRGVVREQAVHKSSWNIPCVCMTFPFMTSFVHEYISSWPRCLHLLIRKNERTANSVFSLLAALVSRRRLFVLCCINLRHAIRLHIISI